MRAAILLSASLAALGCKGNGEPGGSRALPSPNAAPADARPVAGPEAKRAGARVAAVSVRAPNSFGDYMILVPVGKDPKSVIAAIERVAKDGGVQPEVVVTSFQELGLDLAVLDHGVRGLDAQALANAKKVKDVVFFSFTGPSESRVEVQLVAAALARAGVASVDGWILDPFTMEIFTSSAFDERRPPDAKLDVARWTVVHAVQDEGSLVFLETLGMTRLGVPELFVRGVPQSTGDGATEILNAASQALLDRGTITRDGELEVKGPAGTVTWTVVWSTGDYGPETEPRLLELSLAGSGSFSERFFEALTTFFGVGHGTEIVGAHEDDPELLAARRRAMTELLELEKHFAKGIPELEQLIVKAPFTTDDGSVEWMWVEVQTWKGDVMTGVLTNEPNAIARLKIGATVEVHVSELFDYVHQRRDGSKAGGETTEILLRRNGD